MRKFTIASFCVVLILAVSACVRPPEAAPEAPDTPLTDAPADTTDVVTGTDTMTETAVEAPAAEEPAAEEPAAEEPAAEAPVVEEPAAEAPVVEEPAVEAPAVVTDVTTTEGEDGRMTITVNIDVTGPGAENVDVVVSGPGE